MSATRSVLALEAQLRALTGKALDEREQRVLAAFGQGWLQARAEADAMAAEIERLAADGKLTRSKVRRNQRIQQGLAAITRAMQAAIDDALDADQRSVLEAAAAHEAMIHAQLPRGRFTITVAGADPQQIAAIVERTTQNMTATAKPLPVAAQQAIRRELVRAVTMGNNPRVAARNAVRGIEDAWSNATTRASTIARTEQLDAYRAAAQHVEQLNSDVLAGWEWCATLARTTCRSCIGMHGTRHSLDEDGPNDHPNGRCSRVPITRTWAELGFPGIKEPASAMPDADSWFDSLPEADQRQMLTPAGYEAWKRGDWPREKWTTTRQSVGWRDSQQPARPPKA